MGKLTFKRQIIFGIVLILAGNTLAFVSHKGIFSNIVWVIYGLLFIINPVFPERYRYNEKKAKMGVRIAGTACIIVGLISRFIV